jgi:DNA polymerase
MTGLDFETYGACDLKTHGLARYVKHHSFTPLIASLSIPNSLGTEEQDWDIVERGKKAVARELREAIGSTRIVAHNAPFEQAVLSWMGLDYPSDRFVDSAVVARAAGASSHLEAAAPQLLGIDKQESGKDLIKLFSVPGKWQEKHGTENFVADIVLTYPDEWRDFRKYCRLDSKLGLKIALDYLSYLTESELGYQSITMDMNQVGWPVDIAMVEEMQRRYLENMEVAEHEFHQAYADSDINLRSLKQMKEWCGKRGIRATSFDEAHVEKMAKRLREKINTGALQQDKVDQYDEVLHLLNTKQVLGGSSLKKLKVILDTYVDDGAGPRVKDQYVHCGAGQTLRTSGRSVQMQNLKRLKVILDMDELLDQAVQWNNTMMAENMRQVFTSSDEGGRLIVGDFSSIESRGLSYLAGEAWKQNAYHRGEDLYKVLAGKIYGKQPGNVTKTERQTGKVGELSCGYGAGPDAVIGFAAGMGIEMTEGEAGQLVMDWRNANPRTVEFWSVLDTMLRKVVTSGGYEQWHLDNGLVVEMIAKPVPSSLSNQVSSTHTALTSVMLMLKDSLGACIMKRMFHGCHLAGRNVRYFKPSDRKTGNLWKQGYTDPKTKQYRMYELYGGKLAGILTQSFCREIFFKVLTRVHHWADTHAQVQVVGQFHDEIVVDWVPPTMPELDSMMTRAVAELYLEKLMSDGLPGLPAFPLAAEVKSAYRYIK